jgi:hypothetical protein
MYIYTHSHIFVIIDHAVWKRAKCGFSIMFLVTLVKENCGVYPIIQKHLPIRTDLWDGFHCWLYYGLPTIPRYKECICWLICLDRLTKKSKKKRSTCILCDTKICVLDPQTRPSLFFKEGNFCVFFFF